MRRHVVDFLVANPDVAAIVKRIQILFSSPQHVDLRHSGYGARGCVTAAAMH
jgi:hypothetical protein